MAFDTYLEIKGVEGETTAAGYEKKIEIYSFAWGASNPTTVSPGNGGDDTPTESGSFAFGKVEIEYFMQDDKGGLKTAGQASWDLTKVKT